MPMSGDLLWWLKVRKGLLLAFRGWRPGTLLQCAGQSFTVWNYPAPGVNSAEVGRPRYEMELMMTEFI